ncbi:MAG TPA: hypothetical protein VME43_22940 [Bryobacteraceae bacterium]|nr:hypothetical protein [Bryobacteraceae bacterium]
MDPPVDSRQYILALELRALDDCPADFAVPPPLAGFEAGLFLPRDDPDWFGRSAYPPRILLLKDGALHILSHPSVGEPAGQCVLRRVSAVESAHMLLKGRLRFSGPGFDYTVRYNTRGFPAVARFLGRLRQEVLGSTGAPEAPPVDFGGALDLKFANALSRELDAPEAVEVQLFQAPREVRLRSWLLRRRRSMPGDLLALTSRRLLWITDRDKSSRARYGSIARYAPLDAVEGIAAAAGGGGPAVQVTLNHGLSWQIPFAGEAAEDCRQPAEEFAAALAAQKRRHASGRTELRR